MGVIFVIDQLSIKNKLKGLCERCDSIGAIKFQTKHHTGNIVETYFTCDNCGDHVTCFVTDPVVRKKQKEIKKLIGPKYILDRIRLNNDIERRMKVLKQRFANGSV
ncbi:hypothetical protein JNUCC1_03342 [Lentibacillus sp. JNUCC-1]|nr:hypothetical protein [Lentibacillus sp. JNUCC-1]